MQIVGFNSEELCLYTNRQLANFFPVDDNGAHIKIIRECLEETLQRLSICTAKILAWTPSVFDPMLSSQHSSFLYLLANTIWKRTNDDQLPTLLFLLNKSLHGIDLFYKIELPPIFLLVHTPGIVLSNTTYGNYFVIFQNSTVGRFGNDKPILGDGVFLFPNCSIVGRCVVGSQTVLSQGTNLINHDTPGEVTVYQNGSRDYVFHKGASTVYESFFRNPEF